MFRRVQDDSRESILVDLFELHPGISRIGADATDEFGNKYEIKTTTKSKVSTARDFGAHTIERWRPRFWIIARGNNLATEFAFNSVYFLTPDQMHDWYEEHLAEFERKERLRQNVIDRIADLDSDEQVQVAKMLERGTLLNDPGIRWSYVRQNGTEIVEDHAATLRSLVSSSIPTVRRQVDPWLRFGFQ